MPVPTDLESWRFCSASSWRARQADTLIASAFASFGNAVRAGNVFAMLEVVSAERVLERPGIAKAGGSHIEADVLRKNARCNVYREWRHIRTNCHVTVSCTLDVCRFIEQPLPFEGDTAEVELTVATHARSTRPNNVRTPSGITQLSTIESIYGNTTIYNRDKIRIGQRVEYSSWPRTVNAAKDQVVIEC